MIPWEPHITSMLWFLLLDLVVSGTPEPRFSSISYLTPSLEKNLQTRWINIYPLRSPIDLSWSLSFVQEVIWISRLVGKACLGETLLLVSEK